MMPMILRVQDAPNTPSLEYPIFEAPNALVAPTPPEP